MKERAREVKTFATAMAAAQTSSPEIASLLAWWRAAGVDCAFGEEPKGWLKPLEVKAEAVAAAERVVAPKREVVVEPAPVVRFGGDAAGWPGELAAFQEWWLAEPALDGGAVRGRVPPRGAAGAKLMVLVGDPEPEDEGRLLSGPHGRLLGAMLAAMGLGEEVVYLASVLPRHTPLADWAGLAAAGLGEVVRHHVALVRPARLLVFGGGILPLLGHDPAQKPAFLPFVNHEDGSVALLGAPELGLLARRPGAKAAFWRSWLGWN